jgi:hypothetical protein
MDDGWGANNFRRLLLRPPPINGPPGVLLVPDDILLTPLLSPVGATPPPVAIPSIVAAPAVCVASSCTSRWADAGGAMTPSDEAAAAESVWPLASKLATRAAPLGDVVVSSSFFWIQHGNSSSYCHSSST